MASSVESVSLLLGKAEIPIWLGLAIEEMTERTDTAVDDVTIATPVENKETDVKERLYDLVVKFQDQVILSNLDREVDVRLLPSVSVNSIHRCVAEQVDEHAVRLPSQTVDRLTNDVDVVVHHGVGILKGDILYGPDQGVLGYHHGDIREYRGPGYGFWEYMNGDDASGVTLQLLDERLDSGQILDIVTVDISDASTLSEVRRRINAASVPLLAAGIEKLEDPEFSPRRLDDDELGNMYYYSDTDLSTKLRYLVKETKHRTSRALHSSASVRGECDSN